MEVKRLSYNTNDDFDEVKEYVIEHKNEYKTKSLSDSLVIKGIGEKYIKIENNFYSWIEIEKSLKDYKEGRIINGIILSILSWLFADIIIDESTYTPRKFNLDENFEKVKSEIIEHKEYYKRGLISGIGKNNIKLTTAKSKDYYIEWDEIEKIVKNIRYTSFEDLEEKRFSTAIIKELFNDNTKEYSPEELEILEGENGREKLKYYKLSKYGKLSYKVIREKNKDIEKVKELLKLALKWNNGQLPLNITEEGVNHVILDKSSLVRADFRRNDRYTQMIQKDLKEDYKVYTIQYSDEYVYHRHNYKNLIKFEKDGSKWTITYNNKNLLQNSFRKEVKSHWICSIDTLKSTEVCTINDYENENNAFNPDLFTKLYKDFQR
ncbi:MAG: hypothetical protein BZ137_06405 [Methanosphaera sp. rholeuAM130]|nr:hypothetical protein [Methanosphaera sp.]RAP53620.1 MAG: hypothetical protein BZ137_06405 [Methanosphaera sp. rholeuAM130]